MTTRKLTRRVAAVLTAVVIVVSSSGTEAWGKHTSTWEARHVAGQTRR